MKKNILRICHYDILNGGENRLDIIRDIIKKINPDICSLTEAVDWNKNINKYKKKFQEIGYDFFYFNKSNTKYNIILLSKIKLNINIINKNIWHVIVEAIPEHNKDLKIFFVHLCPKNEKYRIKEITELMNKIDSGKKSVIIGDFNSLSSEDKYNEENLIKCFQKIKLKKFGSRKIQYKVINKIKNNNFTDTYYFFNKKFDFSVPTKLNIDISHKQKLRIDYAFVSNCMINLVKSFKIIKNNKTEKGSDHYPIYLEIKN